MKPKPELHAVFLVTCLALSGCELADPTDSPAPTATGAAPVTTATTATPAPPIPADWQTVRAGSAFTFRAPPDLKEVPVMGFDSFVGQYENDAFDVSFDYGRYSNPLTDADLVGKEVTVDGRKARLARKDKYLGIHFAKLTELDGLTISVKLKTGDEQQAEAILRSVDFP